MYTNAYGRAAIVYRSGDEVLTAHYICAHAGSLLQPGAEKPFNARSLISSVVTETVLYQPFFKRIANDSSSGNRVPVPVQKRNLAFTTAYNWIFDRKPPTSNEAKRALALYREGRNAEQNYLISYAVLSYYKILELMSQGAFTRGRG